MALTTNSFNKGATSSKDDPRGEIRQDDLGKPYWYSYKEGDEGFTKLQAINKAEKATEEKAEEPAPKPAVRNAPKPAIPADTKVELVTTKEE